MSSLTPGSFTLAEAGPREGPAPYAFQEAAGQTSVGFNATGPGTTAAPAAAFPATTLADLAPATPPPAWERRVRRRQSTTTADYSPGSWASTLQFQRLSNGVLPSGFGGEPGPSGEGGYSPN